MTPIEKKRRLDSTRLIVSTAALSDDPKLLKSILSRSWDALVIDEAHHIDHKHQLYDPLREISRHVEHVLLLSATPSRRELDGLASLLALLVPEEYEPDDCQIIEQRVSVRQEVWTAIDDINQLIDAAESDIDQLTPDDIVSLIDMWGTTLQKDLRIKNWLSEAEVLSPIKAIEKMRLALAYARERWRLDHRIIRTRRAMLKVLEERFPDRYLEKTIEYRPCAGELELANLLNQLPTTLSKDQRAWCSILQRIATTTPTVFEKLIDARLKALKKGLPESDTGFAIAWNSDPGPAEEAELLKRAPKECPLLFSNNPLQYFDEKQWLIRASDATQAWKDVDGPVPARHIAVISWLIEQASQDASRKFLLFTQDHNVVEEFAAAIEVILANIDFQVRRFHFGMSDSDLEESAFDFIRKPNVRILISDELGGEGRNFQNAWAVIHLDTPISPMRIEQRIGRADRIGRPVDEPVRSVVAIGPTTTESFLYRLHQEVFGVYDASLGGLEFVVPDLVRRTRDAVVNINCDIDGFISSLRSEVDAIRSESDEAFRTAFDTARAELNRARELAELLSEDPLPKTVTAPAHWLKALGIDVRSHGSKYSKILVRTERMDAKIPGVVGNIDIFATWKRGNALQDESLQFLAPGHYLVDGACALLDTINLGRIAFFGRILGTSHQGKLFAVALFVNELPDQGLNLPAGLLARARSELGRDAHTEILRFDQKIENWIIETDQTLRSKLEKPFLGSEGDKDLSLMRSELLKDDRWLSPLCDSLDNIAIKLNELAEELGQDSARNLEKAWAMELSYFDALIESEKGPIKKRATFEKTLRLKVLDKVQKIQPRLDAIALIIGL